MRDLVEIETASFWYDGPEIESGELRTEEIATEVFFLPAAAHIEKDGSFTNTQRLLQWHSQGGRAEGRLPLRALVLLPPRPADPREARRLDRSRATGRSRTLTLGLPDARRSTTSRAPRPCSREINGCDARRGEPLAGLHGAEGRRLDGLRLLDLLRRLRRTASTRRRAASRTGSRSLRRARVGAGRGRRTGACSTTAPRPTPTGKPWSERKRYVWWDDGAGEVDRRTTCPTSRRTSAPDYVPPDGATAEDAIAGDHPFVMQADGRGWLFVPQGLVDGPLPTHYEPHESPFEQPALRAAREPARASSFERRENPYNPAPTSRADATRTWSRPTG